MEQEGDGDTSRNWCTRNNPQWFGKGIRRHTIMRTSGDYPDYSIFKIDQT